jgi:hypothetical protein
VTTANPVCTPPTSGINNPTYSTDVTIGQNAWFVRGGPRIAVSRYPGIGAFSSGGYAIAWAAITATTGCTTPANACLSTNPCDGGSPACAPLVGCTSYDTWLVRLNWTGSTGTTENFTSEGQCGPALSQVDEYPHDVGINSLGDLAMVMDAPYQGVPGGTRGVRLYRSTLTNPLFTCSGCNTFFTSGMGGGPGCTSIQTVDPVVAVSDTGHVEVFYGTDRGNVCATWIHQPVEFDTLDYLDSTQSGTGNPMCRI